MSEEKRHYLLWSGGYDSTAILIKLCEKSSKDNPVYAIDCNFNGLSQDQYKAQQIAKKKILKKLIKKGYHINTLSISVDVSGYNDNKFLVQPLWWNLASINFIKDDSVFHFGYIGSDEYYWKVKKEFETSFYNMSKIMGKKNIKIKYDYGLHSKDEILRLIREAELYDDCWTCESPIKKGRKYLPCGDCGKCIELKMFEYKLKLIEERNKKAMSEEVKA